MFQDMNKMFEESMSPFKDMIDIQTKMLERLTRQQIECTQACFQATVQQASELQNVKTPAELASLQMDYTKKLEAMMSAAKDQNYKTMQEAKDAIQKITMEKID